MTPLPLDVLVDYWAGDLPPEREAEVEERLFEDAQTAARLELVARLDASVRQVVRRGQTSAVVTVETLAQLERAGVQIRTYRIGPGEVVPCGIGSEQFVAVRLHGDFGGLDEVALTLERVVGGETVPPVHAEAVPVDAATGEVVFLYPGALIRSLPQTEIRYALRDGRSGRTLGDFRLDHSPDRG